MTNNPYESPRVSNSVEQGDRQPVLRLSFFEIWNGRIACGCLFVIALIYTLPLVFHPRLAVQPGLMLGISSGAAMIAFKIAYTVCLFASSVGYSLERVALAFWATTIIGTLTVLGLVASAMNWAPLAPFDSVADKFFEILTALASVLMLTALSRRILCFGLHADTERNSATNSAA